MEGGWLPPAGGGLGASSCSPLLHARWAEQWSPVIDLRHDSWNEQPHSNLMKTELLTVLPHLRQLIFCAIIKKDRTPPCAPVSFNHDIYFTVLRTHGENLGLDVMMLWERIWDDEESCGCGMLVGCSLNPSCVDEAVWEKSSLALSPAVLLLWWFKEVQVAVNE
ncbi:hypothetical protein AVEN_70513-1 [Araneus ventricosus]|uniref:Uncharacterized protein n=1 Tax=Araneus ventricosus TaxID=182803 RepID=A0A4Y2Q6E5_ARAVE|nr:hypothetical protein AVEN_70513-1 [Araneus ventricosus]